LYGKNKVVKGEKERKQKQQQEGEGEKEKGMNFCIANGKEGVRPSKLRTVQAQEKIAGGENVESG